MDADVAVHADAFRRIRAAFTADPGLTAVFGSYDDDPPALGAVSGFRNLLHYHVHQSSAGPAGTFWAGLGAVRRDAFAEAGGFDSAFVAPGLVPLSAIHGRTAELVRANPMTGLFESYRDVFLRGQSPAACELLLPLGIAAVALAAFVPLYRAEQAQFAKVLE